MSGCAVWITGLPGSGKSALADTIRELQPGFIILRMDDLRGFVTPHPTYSDTERDLIYRSLLYLAKQLVEAGHDVIIDATGHKREWRTLARAHIERYIEVFLNCPMEICRSREEKRVDRRSAPERVYEKAVKGWPVPGINVEYEKPESPEIVIASEFTSLSLAAVTVVEFLKKRQKSSPL